MVFERIQENYEKESGEESLELGKKERKNTWEVRREMQENGGLKTKRKGR